MTRGGPEFSAQVRDLQTDMSVVTTTFGGRFGGDPPVQVRRTVLDEAGGQLAVLTSDGSLWPIDAARDGTPVRRLSVGREAVTLAFAAAGSVVLVSDRHGVVQLWDTSTATLQVRVHTHMPVSHMAVTPDGRQLVTASTSGTVRIQWLRGGGLLAEACRYLAVDLGPAQWRRYRGAQPQASICPNLPAP